MRARSQTSASNGERSALASDPSWDDAAWQDVGGLAPALHLDRHELARLDQLGQPGTGVGHVETVIVAQVALGGDAQRPGGDAQELALGVLRCRRRQGQEVGREDALGQVVDALEGAAASAW